MSAILLSFFLTAAQQSDINVFFFGENIRVKYGYCLIAKYEYPHYLQYKTVTVAESKTQKEVVFAVCNDKVVVK
jgi:hypothetical protein